MEHDYIPTAARRAVPILAGDAQSDYERYIRTDELLALQKTEDELVDHDEILFLVVHQSSELWLKLAGYEADTAAELLRQGEIGAALRLLRRVSMCLQYITHQLDMLELMSPWEYHRIRLHIGNGSGFTSPGWRRIRKAAPVLGDAFQSHLDHSGLTLVELYVRGREFESLYQLAEALVEFDERSSLWRARHIKLVERILGEGAIGKMGTPVDVLRKLSRSVFYPELWEVRDLLTTRANDFPPE